MDELTSKVRADFDRIASFSGEGWGHNSHYHPFLLRQIPPHCVDAMEIGCGTGEFARLLAERSDRVFGIDLSPNMIRIARERSKQYPNIDFQVANAVTWDFPIGQFDCIASIATFHHLPMEEMLSKVKAALRPGGTLAILDLYKAEGLIDLPVNALAVPVNIVLRLVKNGRLRASQESREAWREHGQRDFYPKLSQVRRVCAAILPGVRVRRHLLWRYSIIWRKFAKD